MKEQMATFDRLVQETKEEIRILLKNPDIRPSFMTCDQLRDVQREICQMAYVRDPDRFYPYYPRGMAEACWSTDNTLVKKLDLIAELYIKGDFNIVHEDK